MEKPPIELLHGGDLDFAVSRGACYYGMAREGQAIRIRGGISRSYFIGIEGSAPAVPGIPPSLAALCVAPFGMEEGEEASVTGQEFSLTLGRKATFRFFSRSCAEFSNGVEAQIGMMVQNWQKELIELHPIETLLDQGDQEGMMVRVKLHTRVTEVGVLELWCVADETRKWKLAFDIREEACQGIPH